MRCVKSLAAAVAGRVVWGLRASRRRAEVMSPVQGVCCTFEASRSHVCDAWNVPAPKSKRRELAACKTLASVTALKRLWPYFYSSIRLRGTELAVCQHETRLSAAKLVPSQTCEDSSSASDSPIGQNAAAPHQKRPEGTCPIKQRRAPRRLHPTPRAAPHKTRPERVPPLRETPHATSTSARGPT